MSFLDGITNFLGGKSHAPEEYQDMGQGLPWFIDYQEKGAPTLSKYFGLEKTNQISIKATIDKTGFYETPKGKRWVVVARYFDSAKNSEFKFYCPNWEYDPIDEYKQGDKLVIYVDKDDYSKYEMPIY